MTDDKDDMALDALFKSAKDATPTPSSAFLARLEADAIASVPKPVPTETPRPVKVHWLNRLFTASGLSGAAIAGVWIGFAMPETLDTFTLTSDDSIALSTFLPSADLGAVFDE